MSSPAKTDPRDAGAAIPHLAASRVWLAAALAIPLLITAAAPMGAVDLAYHLRVGAMMLASGSLVRVDSFTFTASGTPWVDQQWLSQIIFAGLFQRGGWLALALLRSLLAGLALILVYAGCRARGAPRHIAAGLTFGSALLLLPTLQLRPQLLAVACFALTQWLLADRRRRPNHLWIIVPVTLLWSNLHGTFFLAIGLIGLAWIEDLFDSHRGAWRLVVVGVATLAATMGNPYGAQVWRYVLELSNNPAVRGLVLEWQPTSIDSYSGAAFLLSVPVAALLLARQREALHWPTLLALTSFFAIGLMSVRGVYWWALGAPVIIARAPITTDATPRPDPASLMNSILVATMSAVVLLSFVPWLPFYSPASVPEHLVAQAPLGITRALRGILTDRERIFNAQAWGSWLEFALPEHPVTVDSRIELIPPAVWKAYADVSNGREGWQQILADWQVRVAVIYPAQQGELLRRISQDPGWWVAYQDPDGSVFVRR